MRGHFLIVIAPPSFPTTCGPNVTTKNRVSRQDSWRSAVQRKSLEINVLDLFSGNAITQEVACQASQSEFLSRLSPSKHSETKQQYHVIFLGGDIVSLGNGNWYNNNIIAFSSLYLILAWLNCFRFWHCCVWTVLITELDNALCLEVYFQFIHLLSR